MHTLLYIAATCLTLASASPFTNHVVHEKRAGPPLAWSKTKRMKSDVVLPIRIALKQQNLGYLYDYLMDVSQPSSPNFGQHWSAGEIAETFAAHQDSVDTVMEWLHMSGIAPHRIILPQNPGWVFFNATVGEMEDLLKTQYYQYNHLESGQPHPACEDYRIPQHVQEHVDFVTPTIHFDARILSTDVKPSTASESPSRKPKRAELVPLDATPAAKTAASPLGLGFPGNGFLPKIGQVIQEILDYLELLTCNKAITPMCLRALYQIPVNNATDVQAKNSFGIVEFSPQHYNPVDLFLFNLIFSPANPSPDPRFVSIDGAQQTNLNSANPNDNAESNLDLEYSMNLVSPQQVTLYQVGTDIMSGSFNTFLEALSLDKTYCNANNPTYDPQYANPDCGTVNATRVISVSYGMNEADSTPPYEERQCAEYGKLGLMGVSVLFSSGDYGVAGNGGYCLDPVTHQLTTSMTGAFAPSFPGTCPFVTSVGATQIPSGASVTQPETACETVIYSGGGFSNIFVIPDYQKDAVAKWYKNYPPPAEYTTGSNAKYPLFMNGSVRGYPDVSANGANYIVYIDGVPMLVYGTSASSPVFASIIALLNQARLKLGLSPLGFLNPLFYEHPELFNDIVSGGNQGCGTAGFTAVPGWDPVTGLGTPNYPKMLEYVLERLA